MSTAAFYDLDGTLCEGTIAHHYLYYARRSASLGEAGRRLASLLTAVPRLKRLDRQDRGSLNEAFYKVYAGWSRDRLEVLGEELALALYRDHVYPQAVSLLRDDAAAGVRQVLVTGSLGAFVDPLARLLGLEHVACNRLHYDRHGIATGEVVRPVLAGPEKARWVLAFCAEHELDPAECRAYADDTADLPMLMAVGRAVAVNPKPGLAATAASSGWPVLHFEPSSSRGLAPRLASWISRS